MAQVVTGLAAHHQGVQFLQIEAEEFEEISLKYSVDAVPYFIFIKVTVQFRIYFTLYYEIHFVLNDQRTVR